MAVQHQLLSHSFFYILFRRDFFRGCWTRNRQNKSIQLQQTWFNLFWAVNISCLNWGSIWKFLWYLDTSPLPRLCVCTQSIIFIGIQYTMFLVMWHRFRAFLQITVVFFFLYYVHFFKFPISLRQIKSSSTSNPS